MKYESAYFCGYAKLPSALPTATTNSGLTLGLLLELETGRILDASVTLLSELALSMVKSYFIGKNIVTDYDAISQEVYYRHQGVAAKPIVKALTDIRRNYIEYMEKNGDFLRI